MLHVLALEHAGWCGRGHSSTIPVETRRCSIANAPLDDNPRDATSIAESTANGISSIVTPISHPPISAPEIRAPPDQGALDVCSRGTNGRASSRHIAGCRRITAARASPICTSRSTRWRPIALRNGQLQRVTPAPYSTHKLIPPWSSRARRLRPFTYRSIATGLFANILSAGMQPAAGLCVAYPKSMRAER